MASTNRIRILRHVYQKLDNMVLSFGMPAYTDDIGELSDNDIERFVGITLDDTMRELRVSTLEDIEEMSIAEYHIENRCVYHKLKSLRNSASIFFKFSTAVDGKTIDKSMIPKMINEILKEYDNEWKKWLSDGGITGIATGNIWDRSSSNGTSWYREMNE